MSEPKSHHWWPQLQSRHWTNADGQIYAVRADGTHFLAGTHKIAAENELYTRFDSEGEKDRRIEKWFASKIEGPYAAEFNNLVAASIARRPVPADPAREASLRHVGFEVLLYNEFTAFSGKQRTIVANYAAALLVRNPKYLKKISEFHERRNDLRGADLKNMTLRNMLILFKLYQSEIRRAPWALVIATGKHEFFFSDSGIIAEEPWRPRGVPFDVHMPLTPKLALLITPDSHDPFPLDVQVFRASNKGIHKLNELTLSSARRFVFTHGRPPIDYITKHFGVPVPKGSMYWLDRNGRIRSKFEELRHGGSS